MKAFVLINARAGKNSEVISKLRQLQGVSADARWGCPDIFAVAEAANGGSLADTVLNKITV